ncbi:tyrosine-type recombinase/integrase [Guyparkeria halopsychrophila]|uniref:tyrosine-type recombinase/integrase n=1 Tax=Guyparkeria halopsychrophila TaxID=3139421 RepID=UPI0037C6FACF
MAPKRRRKDRAHWPSNLYASKNARGLYYYYLRPDLPTTDSARYNGFGYVTEKQAIDAARQLNQVFGPGGDLAGQILKRSRRRAPDTTIAEYVDQFLDLKLPARRINGHPMSPHTLKEYRRLYRNIKSGLGTIPMKGVEQTDLADFLEDIGTTPEVFNKYRTRLIDLWKSAISDGVVQDNLPARILPQDKAIKRRQRITLPGDKPGTAALDGIEAYRAIFEQADAAVRCAMELSLNALQRREEVRRWRFDWSRDDDDGRHVYIRISKTHKHGRSSYIRVPESLPVAYSALGASTLGDLIAKCRDKIHSPHLVHRRPKRIKKSPLREHPFQLLPKAISDGFSEARDKTGLYDHLPTGERPTFHELLALGEHLREKQGWSAGQIQKLRGHTKESTTRIYLEGHEWSTVDAPKSYSNGDDK